MKTFKIKLTGEFGGTHEIYVLSSVDLTNYEKHKELINKIIMKDNDDEEQDLDYYLNYGKFKIEEFKLNETNLINADNL
jgi:hypothetical protein